MSPAHEARAAFSSQTCRCRLCEPDIMAVYHDGDREFLDGVGKHGWMITNVSSDSAFPRWAYTGGLTHSFGHAELVVAGLRPDLMQRTLNDVGGRVRAGGRLRPGDRLDGVLEGFPVEIRAVHPAWNFPLFGYARWFQQHDEPFFVHIVWPDLGGRWPDDPSFDDRHVTKQPDLRVAPRHSAPGPWQAWAASCAWPEDDDGMTEVIVARAVVSGNAPVVAVVRDDEGSWWFLDEDCDVADAEQMTSADVAHVLDADPSLVELIDLPRGHEATRRGPGHPWVKVRVTTSSA